MKDVQIVHKMLLLLINQKVAWVWGSKTALRTKHEFFQMKELAD